MVAREIVRDIRSAGLEPGTQLSSEAQMLEEYGVGRASLREALRILEVQGLISIKPGPGGGPVVAGVSTRDFGRMATLYFQAGGMTFRELIEARNVMEPVMARLAAERRDPELIEQFKLVSGEAVPVKDDESYLRAAGDFHRLIASASGNAILNLFSLSLEEILHDRVTGMLFPVKRRSSVIDVHRAIAQAIVRGQPARAEKLMREHMTEYADYVKQRYPSILDEAIDWQ